jgi:predicted dinucleotide-binding enzyme
VAYDPAGNQNSALLLGQRVRFATTAQECIEQAAVVVLATPWREFSSIPAEQWARHSPTRTVIDCWRLLDPSRFGSGTRYVPLGIGLRRAAKEDLADEGKTGSENGHSRNSSSNGG